MTEKKVNFGDDSSLLQTYIEQFSGRDPDFEAPFSDEEYRDRLMRTRKKMADLGIDLLFVTSPDGLCYLHNYQSTWYRAHSPTVWPPLAGTAVHVDHDHMIHFDFIDELILLYKGSITTDKRFYPNETLYGGLDFLIKELKAQKWLGGTVGLEFWSHVPNPVISHKMRETFMKSGCTVVDGSMVLRTIRFIKSPQEIAYIEKAARIADIGHKTVQESLSPGVTEMEVFADALHAMLAAGGEMPALNQGIQSGPLMTSHGLSSKRKIQKGEYVFADFCGVVNRYHANICRSYIIGKPRKTLVKLFEAAGGAFEVLRNVAKDGVLIADVNQALRDYYKQVKIWNLRVWVGGYELGISFPPDWVGEFVFSLEDENPEGIFEEGMVTNFESVFWNRVGTGLIDTVVYEKEGARTLSSIEPKLIVIE